MVRYHLDADGIATLTFDLEGRKQNVLDEATLDALGAAYDRARADSAKGIVIASAKKDFVAGADLGMIQRLGALRDDVAALSAGVGKLGVLLRRMETGGIPLVAAIGGTALGGGLEVALACHRRVVADDPRLKLGLPEVTLGLLPGAGGTQRLPRLVGIAASLPLLGQGKKVGAREALALGFVHEVVPAGELLAAARAWLLGSPSAVQPWDQRGFEVPGGGPEAQAVFDLITAANATVQKETFGNFPAPQAILSCVYEGLRLGLDAALEVERRYFVQLVRHPVSSNLIRTLFFGVQAASKLSDRPPGVAPLAVRKLGVLGAGLMGAGIAYVAAKAGIEVVVIDRTAEEAAKAVAYARSIEDRAVSKGKLAPEARDAVLARIRPSIDYDDLHGADVVIEAVFEDRAVKADVTARADARLGDGALLASNTSTLPISGLAAASSRPERFVGLHFFSPVEKMPLVEVIVGERTSTEAVAHALDVVAALGKTPIVVKDSRGFYTSRVFATFVREGLNMLREGVKPALIENAARLAGMPVGPLALADEVSIGLMHQIGTQTRRDLGAAMPDDPSWPVVERMVALGRIGKRVGQGFYDHAGGAKRLWSGLAAEFPVAPVQPSVSELRDRFLAIQVVETVRCLDEGVVRSPRDADVGAILGWGFAPWSGGPTSYVQTVGAAAFVATADALAAKHGARFAVPESLRALAAAGGRYHAV